MKSILISLSFFAFIINPVVFCQKAKTFSEFNKRDHEKFISAKSEHRKKNIEKALKEYCKLLKKYSGNPELELWIGLAYKDKRQIAKALPHLIKATENGTTDNVLLYSTIAELFKEQKDYSKAKQYYGIFLQQIDSTFAQYNKAKSLYAQMDFILMMIKNAVDIDPKPLDYNVNSLFSEYLPQFTADHSRLYFTRRVQGQEDIFYSDKQGQTYSPALPLDEINTKHNEGAHTVSADGTSLIFTHCDNKTGMGSCDLYISSLSESGWEKPKNMGSKINSIAWESQPSISGDGNLLFFSSTRDGGYGGTDIWYSVLNKDGIWSTPKNAGPEINTPQDEGSPFIHADLKTLYFRSAGHLGMGQFDLFVARQDSTKKWKQVQNLGYPINSEGNEGALSVSLSGIKAYFASDYDGKSIRNNLDIYEFDLPEELRPQPCTYVKVRITSIETKFPLDGTLELIDISNGEIISRKKTNINGEILIPIPVKKAMMINVYAEGHMFFSDNIILDTVTHGMAPYNKKIMLAPTNKLIPENDSIYSFVLKNIFFESGTAELKTVSMEELKRLNDILEQEQELNLLIVGHTDDVGSVTDNQELSEARAEAVKTALIKLGTMNERLKTEGKGESQPIADNFSEEGRRVNRRTEFFLYQAQ